MMCLTATAVISMYSALAEVKDLRVLFFQASNDKENMSNFEEAIENLKDPQGVEQGYIAMLYFLKARYEWNPYTRYGHFVEGKTILEKAIKKNPNSIELIFLRHMIQSNLPSILDYDEGLEEDLKFLRSHYQKISDTDLRIRIGKYLKDLTESSFSDHLGKEQIMINYLWNKNNSQS